MTSTILSVSPSFFCNFFCRLGVALPFRPALRPWWTAKSWSCGQFCDEHGGRATSYMINLHVARISSSTDGLSQENDSDHPVPAKTTPANAVGDAGFGSAFEMAWNRSAVCSRRFFVAIIPLDVLATSRSRHHVCWSTFIVFVWWIYGGYISWGLSWIATMNWEPPGKPLKHQLWYPRKMTFRTLLLKSMKSVEYQSVYSGFIWL